MNKVEIKTKPEKLKSLVVGDKVFRSAYDYELQAEDFEEARRQLKETPEVRTASLRMLKEMLAADEFTYRLDDEYLLRFLRCKKFDCDKAFKMMRFFYTLSKDYPDTFATVPPNYESLLDDRIISVLPYRDEDGSMVFVARSDVFKPGKHTIYDVFQYFQPIADVFTSNPSCQIHKMVALVDCKGFGMGHLATVLNPTTLWFWIHTAQNAYTWRIKRIIFVNTRKINSMGLNAVRHLMKKKIADRLVVVGSDMTQLHEYLDPAILPKEYGGSLDDNEWSITQHMMDNLPYVEYEQSFRHPKKR